MGKNVKRHPSQIPEALLGFCLPLRHNDAGLRVGFLIPPFYLPRNDWFAIKCDLKVGDNTKGDVPTIQNLPFDKNLSYVILKMG